MPVRLRNIEDAVSRFSADDRGNVAIILALAAIPVLGATGAAVDYSRALQGRGMLQRVADSAALAAAKLSSATPAQRRKLATTMVENQLSTISEPCHAAARDGERAVSGKGEGRGRRRHRDLRD